MDYEYEEPLGYYDLRSLGATTRAAAIAAFIAREAVAVPAPADDAQWAALQQTHAAHRACGALLDQHQGVRYINASGKDCAISWDYLTEEESRAILAAFLPKV